MSGGGIQAVTFGLGEEVFAIPVTLVREILDWREPFRVPNGPEWLLGLTDVRGEGVPTVDLRSRLGLAAAGVTHTTRALVVEVAIGDRRITLALVVDRVLDVVEFDAGEIEPAPDIGIRWASDYIRGVVRRPTGFVLLIDLASIVSRQDAALLDDNRQAA